MSIRLLGPVEVTARGRSVDLGPRRSRLVLAVLALEANRLVPIDRLVGLNWPGDAPRTARHAIQVDVSRLRAALGDSTITIETKGSGYVLRADPARVDARRFLGLLELARATAAPGDRLAILGEALGMWSGPALAGTGPPETRDRLCRSLNEARATAVRDVIECRLALGGHAYLVPELERLAADAPLDEELHRQLMLACYLAGRQADALAAYRRLCLVLRTELGIDPHRRVRDLATAILRQDPMLHRPAPASPAVLPPPAQLPPALPVLAGRAAARAALDALLPADGPASDDPTADGPASDRPTDDRPAGNGPAGHRSITGRPAGDRHAGNRPPAATVAVLSGEPGSGKSALAGHWAHRAAAHFPDGTVHIDLRGAGSRRADVAPAEALNRFLHAFGIPEALIPAATDARAALYRTMAYPRRMLLILDNARDAAQVRPLLPGAPGSLTVITSRDRLLPLIAAEGARPVHLGPLTTAEAMELLTLRLGAARTAAEPDAARALVTWAGGQPAALARAAAHAIVRPDLPLADLVTALTADLVSDLTATPCEPTMTRL
ncbi:AfsR/SARP family transcriptional regulator [Catenuloplanes japonicus]|uniref:AfsR/SARP family transcriptional regulator n=1 Tax=Catenuloplanes japonicus TaxID=33876 RepID=UPI0006891F53|nr:BTAD domain-containing putative transcriptional regulator [Catenuloplanes japonicus]